MDFKNVSIEKVAEKFHLEAGGSAFLSNLKVRPAAIDRGSVSFQVTVDESHLRTMGIAHGGLVAAILDSSLGCACWTLAPPNHHVVTVQLNINYIRPAWLGETLTAKGEVRHAGQMTAVSRGEVRNEAGALVASAQGTFMFLPIPDGVKPTMEKHDETERWPTKT